MAGRRRGRGCAGRTGSAVGRRHELSKNGVVFFALTPTPAVPASVGTVGGPGVAPHGHEARTRDRVLLTISEVAPVTASELAATLELTPTAVRRHLDALEHSGDIAATEPSGRRRGRGRPARTYVVTPAGHGRMDSTYQDLAHAALTYLGEQLGQDAVAAFAKERAGQLEERYRDAVAAAGQDPSARAGSLAEALARDGYAATSRPVHPDDGGGPHGVQLCQGHCPMHQVASRFPQFCEAEAEAFARLLGVHVQRLATLANGEHVCTTFIPVPEGNDSPSSRDTGQRPAGSNPARSTPDGALPSARECRAEAREGAANERDDS